MSCTDRPVVPLLIAVLCVALVGALLLRFGVLEAESVGAACGAPLPPWWCHGRDALGWAIHFRLFGWLALGTALLAWASRRRGVAWVALTAAVCGLVWYNATLAAFGLVVALLRVLRP